MLTIDFNKIKNSAKTYYFIIKQIYNYRFRFRWRAYFCDKADKERQIGFLLPDHTGFMALMEKYFYQVLNKHFDSGDTRR